MKYPECERVRDHLPEWAEDVLEREESALVEEHLSSCPECRGEAELVRALIEVRPEAPVGLEARIQARLREEGSEGGVASGTDDRTIPLFGWRRWAPTWGLSAAALVVLSLGIGVIWDGRTPEVDADPTEVAGQEPLPEAWLWDDAMVAGAPVYDGLTDEQLETLIQELEG